jgi:ribose/xylose/arabinose/galactoside ABC-type transport system permease subunit
MSPEPSHATTFNLSNILINNAFYIVFIAVFIFFSASSNKFCSVSNLSNLLLQCSYYGILVTGTSLVLISREFDLSVGSVAYLSMSIGIIAITKGYPITLGIILTLMMGIVLGFINGIIVTRLKIPSFISTLGMLKVLQGIGHVLVAEKGGINVPVKMVQFTRLKLGPFYYEVLIMLVIMIIGQIILTKTALGKKIFAIGNNPKAAEHLGVNLKNMKVLLFTLSGLIAAMAGTIYVTHIGYLHAKFADGWEFRAIPMAVIGGVSLFGGRGSILPGALLGVVLVVMLENGLTIIGVDPYAHPFVIGVVIFLAILTDSLKYNYRRR